MTPSSPETKSPRPILEGIFAFPPNRETLGGTSYFIVENEGNILIDCPAWNEVNVQFMAKHGGVKWLFITHRGGIGQQVSSMQATLSCEVVIQEQEAYLLPEVKVTTFEKDYPEIPHCRAIWTPGFSPGSSCLYYKQQGGVLFTGRHLLPNSEGKPMPLRMEKTFHWFRQLRSLEALQKRFSPANLDYLCPGGNTGFLRGRGVIENAYEQIAELDVETLAGCAVGTVI